MLLDETIFTLGPDSDMVLDEFVYDPVTSAGKVTARVTKGVFRFVTGKIARKKPASMNVKLPVGTIGIRGTMAAGKADAQGVTVILLGPGADNNADEGAGCVSVENAGKSVLINRAGYGTTIAPGQPPAAVMEMSRQAAEISAALAPKAASKSTRGDSKAAEGKASATSKESGQETAAAGETLTASLDTSELAAALDATSNDATQDTDPDDIEKTEAPVDPFTGGGTFADGISIWDEVRTITTGEGVYSGAAAYSSPLGPGTMTLYFEVDFANRIFGSDTNSSYLSLSIPISHTTYLYENSFDSLPAGNNAVITLDGSAYNCSWEFQDTTLTFENAGNVAAQNVRVDLLYDNLSTNQASGSMTVPRTGP